MAKLGVYYGLCPLIDHRSLLGILPAEESGLVIVTLGKNVAIKYRLSDQKQLHSWRTKDKFTAPLLYDKKNNYYVGVFNETFIKVWNDNENNEDEFLDKIKRKHKFKQKIFTIFSSAGNVFILFKDGNVMLLETALNDRKKLELTPLLRPEETILDVLHTHYNKTDYVGLLLDNNNLLWINCSDNSNKRITLTKNGNAELTGCNLHINHFGVNLLTLWSDGSLYNKNLTDEKNEQDLITMMDSISCNQYVSMKSLDQHHVAMYGNSKDEDGALLFIFNIQFRVIHSRQPFKMFNNGAKLYCIDNNLFLPVGQNLAVIPFRLESELLMSLVGSHKPTQPINDADVTIVHKMIQANWGYLVRNSPNSQIKAKIDEYIEQGFPENLIMEFLIENCNMEDIKSFFSYFLDLPESILAKTLKVVLNYKIFNDKTLVEAEGFPKDVQPLERTKIIDLILTKDFSDVLITPHLRKQLNVTEIVTLLEYIYFLLSEEGHSLPSMDNTQTYCKLISWTCSLLDSSYQQLLLSKNERISNIVKSLNETIEDELDFIDDLNETFVMLNDVARRKSPKKQDTRNKSYTIEEVEWY